MSEAKQRALHAARELAITAEQHGKFRGECIEKAIQLAAAGRKDDAYTKLLMVVAIDSVRDMVAYQKTDDAIDSALERNTEPKD